MTKTELERELKKANAKLERAFETTLRNEYRMRNVRIDGEVDHYFWSTNDNPVPIDWFTDRGFDDFIPTGQKAAIKKHDDHFIAEYKKAQANRTSEEIAEQEFEMNAAFGPGQKIVNAITGKTYTTR